MCIRDRCSGTPRSQLRGRECLGEGRQADPELYGCCEQDGLEEILMDIQTIDKNLLSDLHRKAVANERKRMNFDLRTSALDQSQRMLNALEPGTQVPVHRHMETAETTICIEGYLEVVLYAEASGQDETGGERKFVEVSRVTLCPREGKYGVQIPLGVWHSVDVKEPSTIFEAKDGAYVSASR